MGVRGGLGSRWPLAAALAACALGACLARQAQRIQEQMVGLSGRDLRSCLGAPSSFEEIAGRGVWVYEAPYQGPEQDVNIEIASGPGTGARPPTVTSGEVARETLRGTDLRGASVGRVPPGLCVLVFELEQGRVTRFRSIGRSASGVTAAAQCTLLVRGCIPSPTSARTSD